ncbi:MAG: purine-binding protein [Clostridia bacterium]|jgi:basic membrane lipoprotein Med (substrate-binding protein (PBP1-ABC) superfamily)|uniref:BMP family ABC transporter substrate-binding protein n=1 Tax=Petroclostridium xylanilyticum TaxID=1792311 RepID=UPI000B9934DF|nr:BMP family ABC transporter substrate-binding protein [Petroclostridium xylanilyticum]MBZ4646161.1 purine-binding protein [Clostridia bacterium]
MKQLSLSDNFIAARKLALKEFSRNISNGQTGYLPCLEGVIKNTEIVSEVDLGVVDIPLKKIIGTYTHLRSISFARNFMPLLESGTEFEAKWSNLCAAHLSEGIRDPIKAYEYLNWFYVIEGNKRVSVLKYHDAYSIPGHVIRLIPKKQDNDLNSKIYYEFLEFYDKTGINSIWFSKENSFNKLLEYLENFQLPEIEGQGVDKYRYFANGIYYWFRKIYLESGGNKLNITTGDAFLEYIKIFGIPIDIDEIQLRSTIKKLYSELEALSERQTIDIQTKPPEDFKPNVISAITTLVTPKKKLKVAFAYGRTIQTSGWTYAHELGRLHVEKVLGDQITTSYIENVPETEEAYQYFKQLAEEENDIVFTTSPTFINPTLKAALEYPQVKFLNCSETHTYKHVSTYFGRIYEPRFLAGIIAGAMTKTDMIGYVASYPIPEVISSINAFALGAKMVNPYVTVKVAWTHQWLGGDKSKNASIELIEWGADIISHQNTLVPQQASKEFGVYSTVCDMDKKNCVPNKHLALPIWHWGIFYEKMLKNIINGSWNAIDRLFSTNSKLVNFWWGMDAGVVDIFYSKKFVPLQTQKLVEFIKKMIMNNAYDPFTGPVYDQAGVLRINAEERASNEQILSMDWFVDIVEGELPKPETENIPEDPLIDMLGVENKE